MRASLVAAVGATPVVSDRALPEPGPGEALVRVTAAAINPVDLHVASGYFFDGPPKAPYIPGLEGVGIVERGDTLEPGTRVRLEIVHPGYGRDGTLAEYVVIPETAEAVDRSSQAQVMPLNSELTDATVAAVGTPGCTALGLLGRAEEAGAKIKGAVVLVLAATGSVGTMTAQLARRLGAARVIGAGRDPEGLRRLEELGVDATVQLDGDLDTLRERFTAAAGGRLDIVFEPLWGVPARAAMESLSAGGVHVNFGHAAGIEVGMLSIPLRNRRLTVVGYSGAWTTPIQRRDAFERLMGIMAEGGVTLDVEAISLAGVTQAWDGLRTGRRKRYVVLPGD